MGLSKAIINIYQGTETSPIDKFEVCFNPDSYKVTTEYEVSSKKQVNRKGHSNSQITGSKPQTLSLKLFFDTYEKKISVTQYTNRLLALLQNNKTTQTQNSCEFVWGKFKFRGLVSSLCQEFTMFLKDGTPVRANMDLTINAETITAVEKEDAVEGTDISKLFDDENDKNTVDNPRNQK
ncbi:MAG TPA: hypothetical protein VHP38_14220 [Ruminiclostridium sp.]|nr:hypothetical protein [Ruminiclostridium sp.]